jgi:hypothetical protein
MMKIKARFIRKNLFVNYVTGGGNDRFELIITSSIKL